MGVLNGKVVLVTGGAVGIGGAISARFAAEGARVFATTRNGGDDLGDKFDAGSLRRVRADASDPNAMRKAIEEIGRSEGRIDVLVANAGIAEQAPLGDGTAENFDRIFALNVRALVLAVRDATSVMPDGGSVVLIGSIADRIGTIGFGAYNASKAAVRSYARTLANELAPRKIRVNVVAPGPIDTQMFAGVGDELRDGIIARLPLKRMGRPEEVAAAALFLASDESSFVTGAVLPVDGGMTQV